MPSINPDTPLSISISQENYFIALQAEATKDEDDEPVEMFLTTRELKEMSSQVEAN